MTVTNPNAGNSVSKQIPRWSLALPLVPLSLWAMSHLIISDTDLFYLINRSGYVAPDAFWGFFVFLGNGWGVFSLSFPLLIFAPRLLIAGACAGAMAGIFSRSLKVMFDTPRPPAVLETESFVIIGRQLGSLSMPSGHAITAFAIATAFYFAMPIQKRKPFWWLFVLATLSGVARITVGVHWPSDVFAGIATGLLSGVFGAYVSTILPSELYEPQSWLMRLVGIVGIVAMYLLWSETLDFELNRSFQVVGFVTIFISLTHFIALTFGRSSINLQEKTD